MYTQGFHSGNIQGAYFFTYVVADAIIGADAITNTNDQQVFCEGSHSAEVLSELCADCLAFATWISRK